MKKCKEYANEGYTYVVDMDLEKLLFLKENDIISYIKLQTHKKMKTKAYQKDIGKYYNMTSVIHDDTHYYVCADGRYLDHQRTETHNRDGFLRTFEVYM